MTRHKLRLPCIHGPGLRIHILRRIKRCLLSQESGLTAWKWSHNLGRVIQPKKFSPTTERPVQLHRVDALRRAKIQSVSWEPDNSSQRSKRTRELKQEKEFCCASLTSVEGDRSSIVLERDEVDWRVKWRMLSREKQGNEWLSVSIARILYAQACDAYNCDLQLLSLGLWRYWILTCDNKGMADHSQSDTTIRLIDCPGMIEQILSIQPMTWELVWTSQNFSREWSYQGKAFVCCFYLAYLCGQCNIAWPSFHLQLYSRLERSDWGTCLFQLSFCNYHH